MDTELHDFFTPTYENEQTNRSLRILNRSKKKRIQNKHFKRVFTLALQEKDAVMYHGMVLMSINYYDSLVEQIETAPS